MLTKEYLDDRITFHQKHVEAHVLAHHRSHDLNAIDSADRHLAIAAQHAAIFTALTAIMAQPEGERTGS